MFSFRIITLAVTLAGSITALTVAPLASAKGGDGIRVSGVCTQGSSAKLKLKHEDSGTEVEFEVDQNRNGVPWKVTVRRSGSLVASTTMTTKAPSGSFSFHRVISDTQGKIVAVATRASGERCTAQASTAASAQASTAAGVQANTAKNRFDLKGEVYPNFKIEMKNKANRALKTVKAGTYRIKIEDKSAIHNFHLVGPGVNKSTSVSRVGETTWTIKLNPGTYTFLCDPHASMMRGSFRVTT